VFHAGGFDARVRFVDAGFDLGEGDVLAGCGLWIDRKAWEAGRKDREWESSSTYSIVDDSLHGHEDFETVGHDVLGLAVVNLLVIVVVEDLI